MRGYWREYVVIIAAALLAACNSRREVNKEQPAIADSTAMPEQPLLELMHNNPSFTYWTNNYHIQPADSFTESTSATDLYIYPDKIDTASYSLYKPVLVYNRDSSSFIDAFSYRYIFEYDKAGRLTARGGDPETEVAVVNLKTMQRTRIYYCGTGCIIQKVSWVNDDEVAVAGMVADNEDEVRYMPVIWFINTKNGHTVQYEYGKTFSEAEAVAYLVKEISAKGIVFEDDPL